MPRIEDVVLRAESVQEGKDGCCCWCCCAMAAAAAVVRGGEDMRDGEGWEGGERGVGHSFDRV